MEGQEVPGLYRPHLLALEMKTRDVTEGAGHGQEEAELCTGAASPGHRAPPSQVRRPGCFSRPCPLTREPTTGRLLP